MTSLTDVWTNIKPSWSTMIFPPAYTYSYFNNLITTLKTGTQTISASQQMPSTNAPVTNTTGLNVTGPLGTSATLSKDTITTMAIIGAVALIVSKKI